MEHFIEKTITIDGDACAVVLVEAQGTDASVWRAARVCKGGGFNPDIPERDVLTQKLAGLWKARHGRCFEHARIVFGIRAPLWLVDHLRTYRAPFVSRSLRYCEPLRGSRAFPSLRDDALELYDLLIARGTPREEARKYLTQDVLTETFLPWDLRQFFHACDERIHSAAQDGTRQVVEAMLELAEAAFPCAVAAYKAAKGVEK